MQSNFFHRNFSLSLVVPDTESEISLLILVKSAWHYGNNLGFEVRIQGYIFTTLYLAIKNYFLMVVARRSFSLKVKSTEAEVFVISLYVECSQTYRNLDRDVRVVSIHVQLKLRVILERFKVRATTSCLVCHAPFTFYEYFIVDLCVEVLSNIDGFEVSEKVAIRYPKDTVICSYIDFVSFSCRHTFVDNLLTLLIPFLGIIAPSSSPLFVSPRIPHLDELVSIDHCNIKYRICMT